MNSISLLKLARIAGVSKTTASLILNGKSDRYKISQSTKKRVLRIAKENNYKPNILARNLSMGKSMSIGIIVSEISNFENAALIGSIEKELFEKGYQMVLGIPGTDTEKYSRVVSEMTERRVDGMVVFESEEVGDILGNESIPYVWFGKNKENIPSVWVDADSGIRKLIGYWYPHGKRSIGYIGMASGNEDRKNSYRENYIERFSMQGDRMLLLKQKNAPEKMKKALLTLAAKSVNAIMFETSELAFLALKTLKSLNDPVLNNISLGSFGYHPAFYVAGSDVLYVKIPYDSVAAEIVNMVLNSPEKNDLDKDARGVEPEFPF